MYIAMIVSTDEPDEGPHVVLGPFDTAEAAQGEGEAFVQYMDDEYPDHEWDVDVQPVRTYEEALIDEGKAQAYVQGLIQSNPDFFNHR